ncbi:MAG TPA: hypothetical protein VD887_00370 [Allosphingosinicella sp.]|nr:hypothetical protein [Allosphingosinicella sp.]
MDDGFDRQEVRDDLRQENGPEGGRQKGGGPEASDMGAGGGSSGSGGYGRDQHAENLQGQGQGERSEPSEPAQSRGERFDEQSAGGRGAGTVSFDRERDGGDGFGEDQRAHQDRGQSEAEDEVE